MRCSGGPGVRRIARGHAQASREEIQLIEWPVRNVGFALPHFIAFEHDVLHRLRRFCRTSRRSQRCLVSVLIQAQGLQDHLELIERIRVTFRGRLLRAGRRRYRWRGIGFCCPYRWWAHCWPRRGGSRGGRGGGCGCRRCSGRSRRSCAGCRCSEGRSGCAGCGRGRRRRCAQRLCGRRRLCEPGPRQSGAHSSRARSRR